MSPSIQSSSYFSLEALLCVLAVTNYRAEYRTNDCGVRKLKIVTLTFAAAGCSNWSGRSAPAAPRLGTKVQPLHSGRQSGSCEAMPVFTSYAMFLGVLLQTKCNVPPSRSPTPQCNRITAVASSIMGSSLPKLGFWLIMAHLATSNVW